MSSANGTVPPISGADSDTVLTGSGSDWIDAGNGDDSIKPSDGQNTALAGAGHDLIVSIGVLGATSVDGGADNDTIRVSNLGNVGALNDGDGANNDFIDLSAFHPSILEFHADQNG